MRAIGVLRDAARRLPGWAADGLLALALFAVSLLLIGPLGEQAAYAFEGPAAVALVIVAVTNLPLVARRVAPGAVLAVIGLGAVAAAWVQLPTPGLALAVALYSVALLSPREESLTVLGVFAGFTALALFLADALYAAPLNVLVYLTAWILGDRQRLARARTAELQARAEHLEREHAELRALAATEEREHLAEELHDVVAHAVSAMIAQAAAAGRLLEHDPDRAEEALLAAERTGRQGVAELRRVLGVLRAGTPEPSAEPVP